MFVTMIYFINAPDLLLGEFDNIEIIYCPGGVVRSDACPLDL